jgi:hypothetical protein
MIVDLAERWFLLIDVLLVSRLAGRRTGIGGLLDNILPRLFDDFQEVIRICLGNVVVL